MGDKQLVVEEEQPVVEEEQLVVEEEPLVVEEEHLVVEEEHLVVEEQHLVVIFSMEPVAVFARHSQSLHPYHMPSQTPTFSMEAVAVLWPQPCLVISWSLPATTRTMMTMEAFAVFSL